MITVISDCTAVAEKEGHWVEVGSSPGKQEMQFSYGITRSYMVRKTKSWEHSTTISVTAGFSFGGFSASTTISHETSRSFSVTHENTFSMSQTETYTTELPAGTVWQFQMDVKDNCGTSGVHMKDFQVTRGSPFPPCCLPGFFKDPQNARGDCLTFKGEYYNVCQNTTASTNFLAV